MNLTILLYTQIALLSSCRVLCASNTRPHIRKTNGNCLVVEITFATLAAIAGSPGLWEHTRV